MLSTYVDQMEIGGIHIVQHWLLLGTSSEETTDLIALYDKQGKPETNFYPSPRGTCLSVTSDLVCAYQKHEATDVQREIEQQGVHRGNLQLGEGCRHCTEHQLYA